MPAAEYTVRLDAFEGPLDLLLFLIRRAEVEIADIQIATITHQYLDFLNAAALGAGGHAGIDIEEAGEFLVMAATLMEIKSRTLMPAMPGEGEPNDESSYKPAIDPRADLVKQLLEYKRFRDAGDQLECFRRDWHGRFPAGRAYAGEVEEIKPEQDAAEVKIEVGDLTLVDLVEAFSRIIDTVDFSRVGEHHVLMDDTPIEVHAEELVVRLRERMLEGVSTPPAEGFEPGEMDFREVFTGRGRGEAIGMFLAVLELVKQQRLGVRQDDAGRVAIKLIDDGPEVSHSPRLESVVDTVSPN